MSCQFSRAPLPDKPDNEVRVHVKKTYKCLAKVTAEVGCLCICSLRSCLGINVTFSSRVIICREYIRFDEKFAFTSNFCRYFYYSFIVLIFFLNWDLNTVFHQHT